MEDREFWKVYLDFLKSRGNEDLLPEGYHVIYNHSTLSVCLYNDKGQHKRFCEELIHQDII